MTRACEEFEDIRALDAALAKPNRRMIPFEVTSAILDGASPIRAWREHRGLSPDALAHAAGIEPSRLSGIEGGQVEPAADGPRNLVAVLGVQPEVLAGCLAA